MILVDYDILSIRKMKFSDCNINDEFFDSLKIDYPGFTNWFAKKSNSDVYVHQTGDKILGFLYLKVEGEDEDYSHMEIPFNKKRRMKIGTFKISENGFYMGERFFKIIFENAVRNKINEIYVTIYPKHTSLIEYFKKFGFKQITKISGTQELVLARNLENFENNSFKGYPQLNINKKNFYLLPVVPKYHTKLLPDAILNTEDSSDFLENEVAANTLRKVYLGKNLWSETPDKGDIILFYRTKDASNSSPAHYQSVITSVGVVSNYGLVGNLPDVDLEKILNKSVLGTEELNDIKKSRNKYRYLEFIYFGKLDYRKVNLAYLRKHGIEAPRGLKLINPAVGRQILRDSQYKEGIILS